MTASRVDLDSLLDALERLVDEHNEAQVEDPGAGNFNCDDCVACYNCRFCTGCASCEDCTYCEGCVDCRGCTQTKRSLSCESSSYLEDCRGCEGSKYLMLCVDCSDSTHCLGCVGLKGAEFCVLNEKVGKKRFYEMLGEVRATLEARVEGGWRPEPIGLEGEEDTSEAESGYARDEEPGSSRDADPLWGASSERERRPREPAPRQKVDEARGASAWDEAPAVREPSARPGLRRGARPARPRGPKREGGSATETRKDLPLRAQAASPWEDDPPPEREVERRSRPASRPREEGANAEPDRDAGLRRGRRPKRHEPL